MPETPACPPVNTLKCSIADHSECTSVNRPKPSAQNSRKDSFSLKNNGLAGCREVKPLYNSLRSGGVAEWSKAAVLKTVECNSSQGSNPCPTAISLPAFLSGLSPKSHYFLLKFKYLSISHSCVKYLDFAYTLCIINKTIWNSSSTEIDHARDLQHTDADRVQPL